MLNYILKQSGKKAQEAEPLFKILFGRLSSLFREASAKKISVLDKEKE